jgi:MFS transporter, DHA1 family, multidrug resistance protein
MRRINESKPGWNTLIAFSLIPLSGFAMDIFIPSLPDMSKHLRATPEAIQLTLSIFMISGGISQLVVGSLVDSYGRYLPNLFSLLVFSLTSFAIAYSTDLQFIYWMRGIQGLVVAIIAVSRRAFFIDLFKGEQLKKYTSMFSVIWAIAPIVAPFLGGFFQTKWGWTSNFMFLGYFGFSFFLIELFTGGESLKTPQMFQFRPIFRSYIDMLKTPDFTKGIVIIGLIYAMVLVYGMCSPFLIVNRLHLSPSVTGYCSLFSGVCVFIGGTTSRLLIQKPFFKKLLIANILQLISVAILMPLTLFHQNIITLLVYIFCLHSLGGFIYNNFFSYCLMRFPQYAGKASGLIGGGFGIVTSIISSLLISVLTVSNQTLLGVVYCILSMLVFILLVSTKWRDGSINTMTQTSKIEVAMKNEATGH